MKNILLKQIIIVISGFSIIVLPFILQYYTINFTVAKSFISLSHYISLFTIIIWLKTVFSQLSKINSESCGEIIRKSLPSFIIALITATLIFCVVNQNFRVPSDESSILSVSRSIYSESKSHRLSETIYNGNEIIPIKNSIPNRSSLFSTLISITHSIVGYHYKNVFALNLIVMILLLTLAGNYINRSKHILCLSNIKIASCSLLIISSPIVVFGAISGHYDIFFTLLSLLIFTQLKSYLQKPSQLNFNAMWMSIVMLIALRHEGLIYIAPSFLILIYLKKIPLQYIFKSHYVALTPIFYSQLFWHFYSYSNFLKQFTEKKIELFSVANFIENSNLLFKKLFLFDNSIPFSHLSLIIGILCAFYQIFSRVSFKNLNKNDCLLVLLPTIYVTTYLIFFLSWFWSYADDPAVARLYTFPVIVLTLCGAIVCSKFLKSSNLLIISSVIFIIYFPDTLQNKFIKRKSLFEEHIVVSAYFNNIKDERFNLIIKQPHKYTIYNYGSFGFSYANKNYESLYKSYQNGLFDKIYVLQRINKKNGKVTDDTNLIRKYKLLPKLTMDISRHRRIRISKIEF